ncbi:ion channel [Natrinema salifodinae]|uniref:Voltage-gated potassium channel n=1 Tax=Natrinema salifodinae TaxID=1202768 RepID=A0A1I0P5N9_9EURY|nr:ion channel [Natrinema salifodinae]SEW09372.1 voltage-gated potassium channel [Natrinema salifodinae]
MLDSLHPRRPGGRVAVWIVAAIALASIATGVGAILTQPVLDPGGLLGDLQAAAEFSGTVVGFALLVTAWGMRRGYRLAYVTAVGLVTLAAAHGIVQFRTLSVPLVVLSLGGLLVLVATSERFTRSSSLDATQIGALLAIVGVFCYGTAGAYALRSGFDGVESVVDAVYFTVVTASTVGYGDVHATTETARLFAVSLVVLGPATIAATLGSLVGPALETHLERTGERTTAHLGRDAEAVESEFERGIRIVALGFDETIAHVVAALSKRASVVVVVMGEDDPVRLPDGVTAVVGEPTAEQTLERAGIETCDAVLVGTEGFDAAAAITAARSLTDARIVTVAGSDSTVAGGGSESESDESLEQEGADVVVVDPEAVLVDATVGALVGDRDPANQSSASAASHSG